MSTFDLAKLIPESLTFRDADGCAYAAHRVEHFGPIELATYERLQQQVDQAYLEARSPDLESRSRAAALLTQSVNEIMGTIVPSLDRERVAAIAFGHKAAFLKWWREQNTPAQPPGEAPRQG